MQSENKSQQTPRLHAAFYDYSSFLMRLAFEADCVSLHGTVSTSGTRGFLHRLALDFEVGENAASEAGAAADSLDPTWAGYAVLAKMDTAP